MTPFCIRVTGKIPGIDLLQPLLFNVLDETKSVYLQVGSFNQDVFFMPRIRLLLTASRLVQAMQCQSGGLPAYPHHAEAAALTQRKVPSK